MWFEWIAWKSDFFLRIGFRDGEAPSLVVLLCILASVARRLKEMDATRWILTVFFIAYSCPPWNVCALCDEPWDASEDFTSFRVFWFSDLLRLVPLIPCDLSLFIFAVQPSHNAVFPVLSVGNCTNILCVIYELIPKRSKTFFRCNRFAHLCFVLALLFLCIFTVWIHLVTIETKYLFLSAMIA